MVDPDGVHARLLLCILGHSNKDERGKKRGDPRHTEKIYAHATRLTSNANLRAKTNGDEIRKGGTVDGRREGQRESLGLDKVPTRFPTREGYIYVCVCVCA